MVYSDREATSDALPKQLQQLSSAISNEGGYTIHSEKLDQGRVS